MSEMQTEESLTKKVPVVFYGAIIDTLTQELPSDTIALRELIKNAYDASADVINIKLDTKNAILTIEDDGDGMDSVGLENLFHVGRSSKNYGKEFESTRSKEIRYAQGSKGVGFLSAMHFGSSVTWISKKEDTPGGIIQCDRTYLESLEDLSKAELILLPYDKKNRGTHISVKLDEYHLQTLKECFNSKLRRSKICNTFRKSKIAINLSMDGEKLPTEKVADFSKMSQERRLFYVKISQETKSVEIYNGEKLVERFDFPSYRQDCYINGEIVIFDMKNARSATITDLFINHNNSLAPLVYINDNLFEDDDIFDPDILRKSSSAQVMAQMIGYIDIDCSSSLMQFNTDRTRLVQNPLSDYLYSCLRKINETMQKRAAAHKVDAGVEKGLKIPQKTGCVARISLKAPSSFEVTSNPLNLYDFIYIAKDAKNNDIPFDKIEVYIDGEKSETGILPSQSLPGTVAVMYRYKDAEIGEIAQEIHLQFKVKSIPKVVIPLLLHGINEPQGPFAKVATRLMGEINELYEKNANKYFEIVACALRAVFELSVNAMRNTKSIPSDLSMPMTVEDAINAVFTHMRKDNTIQSKVAQNGSIHYDDLKNFDVDKFVNAYKTSHRGAHKSSAMLSPSDIKDIGMRASEFAHIVSVLMLLYRNGKI